jgi:hypothetical protein
MKNYVEGSKQPLLPSLKSQSLKNQSWEKNLKTLNHDLLVSRPLLSSKMMKKAVDNHLIFSAFSSFSDCPLTTNPSTIHSSKPNCFTYEGKKKGMFD